MIKDSGTRRTFDSGAERDIRRGKGRCDLLPLDVIATIYEGHTDRIGAPYVLKAVYDFTVSGDTKFLEDAIEWFLLNDTPFGDANWATLWLEVSKHFEEGCKKYGENNWRKGIPAHCYIDSGVRHYLKWLRGSKDEPHHRAFIWNMICCIWTCRHMPELNEYRRSEADILEEKGDDLK